MPFLSQRGHFTPPLCTFMHSALRLCARMNFFCILCVQPFISWYSEHSCVEMEKWLIMIGWHVVFLLVISKIFFFLSYFKMVIVLCQMWSRWDFVLYFFFIGLYFIYVRDWLKFCIYWLSGRFYRSILLRTKIYLKTNYKIVNIVPCIF